MYQHIFKFIIKLSSWLNFSVGLIPILDSGGGESVREVNFDTTESGIDVRFDRESVMVPRIKKSGIDSGIKTVWLAVTSYAPDQFYQFGYRFV